MKISRFGAKVNSHSREVAGTRVEACRRPPAGRRPRGILEAAAWESSARNPDPVLIFVLLML